MSYVFLSYSRRDGEQHVNFLEKAIPEQCGFPVWRDKRGIDPAQDFGAELEKAIEGAERVVVCLTKDTKRDNSFVRREIGYALAIEKPIYVARFHKIVPHLALVNHTYVDFFAPPPEQNLPTLCEWLHRPATAQPASTDDPFRPYLNGLYQFVVNFLDGAVIRQIDLGITDRPDQVPHPPAPRATARLHNPLQLRVMPWMQPNTPAPPQIEAFDTFGEAFEAYQERVVLLGEPGAGKTITLLNQLRESITARLADPAQPLPLFAFITSWDAQNRQAFPVWLQQQQPTLNQAQIQSLLASGQAVLFLDGLDELGAEREEKVKHEGGKDETRRYDPRQRFIETFTAAIGSNRALVSCRVRDYADIGAQIPLNGAVELNPLSDEQIREYLAELPELLAAIEADDNLKQMLRTPLLMSLFAFAFRDELTPDQRQTLRDMAHTDAEDLRDQIILLYLERRYQWEASKGLPMAYACEDWLAKLQLIAYRGVDTFANRWFRDDQYKDVDELNILRRDNIALDLPHTDVGAFLVFSQSLNIILPIETDTYRFQHLLLLGTLASPVALNRLEKGQEAANACRVLGELRVNRAVQPLIHALGDADKWVRRHAAEALGRIGWQPTTIDETIAYAFARQDWKALITISEPAVPTLIHALGHADGEVRASAAVALGKIGERAVQPLIHALGDTDRFVRSSAAVALGMIGDTRAVQPLIQALGNKNYLVHRHVAAALGMIGDARAVEPLIQALGDKRKRVRSSAAVALGKIGDTKAVEPLIRVLGDADMDVRSTAAEALGQIRDTRAVGPLIRNLSETDSSIRNNAAWALGQIRNRRAVRPLIRALGDADAKVRSNVAEALGNIGDTRAVQPLIQALGDADWQVRRHAAEALGNIGDTRAVQPLIHALGDAHEWVRSRAAEALGKIGDARAVEPLTALLNDQHRSWWRGSQRVCDRAAIALEQIGTPDARAAREAWLAAGNRIIRY